jgi:hypothetical protein
MTTLSITLTKPISTSIIVDSSSPSTITDSSSPSPIPSTIADSISTNLKKYIGFYVYANTTYYIRDGWFAENCKIIDFDGINYLVQNKHGKQMNIGPTNIILFLDPTPVQKFYPRDIVNAQIDYCQRDGIIYADCEILSCKIFADDVDYSIRVIATNKILTVCQTYIRSRY